MDTLAFILGLAAFDITDAQAAQALAEYIEEHPEAIAEVSVATTTETANYLGIN